MNSLPLRPDSGLEAKGCGEGPAREVPDPGQRWLRVTQFPLANSGRMAKFLKIGMRTLTSLSCGAMLLAGAPAARASFTLQIVADNDFAVFAGSPDAVTRVIYHNDVIWNSQLAAASSFTFDLVAGESVFYLLGMGGSGAENISGKINGVNIVKIFQDDPNSIVQSNPVETLLTGYDLGAVSNGTYTPALSDVQAALPTASWSPPAIVSGPTVVNSNPEAYINGQPFGFNVPSSQAVLFRFDAANVGVPTVPEPSTVAMFGFAAVTASLQRRRRRDPI